MEERGESPPEVARKSGGTVRPAVSARKLGAGIWRLQSPEFGTNGRQSLGFQFEPSVKVSNSSMEGATNFLKPAIGSPLIPTLEKQLKQARARINELETEGISSKDKLEQFLQKFGEERTAWKSREHEKVRAIVDDMKSELIREKKNRQRLEMVHSKLINELSDAKLSVKRCLQQYGKERKGRELAEEVCDELARETGEDKAEFEKLKLESKKLWEEMEEERKMLQMAEVWREERVQMKLVDAKIMLEEKHSQMNRIIADLEAFPRSRSTNTDLKDIDNTEFLREVAYKPPNPDMHFLFEGITFGESNKREVSPCSAYSPEVKLLDKDSANRRRDVYMDRVVEDASVWEALSQSDGQGSSYSTNGSDPSVNNVSREWERNGGEETPITDSETSSKRPSQFKKASSISRLRRSCPSHGANYEIISAEGVNQKLSNARLSSTGDIKFPNCGSAEQWSSRNPHRTRGTKGGIEQTRGTLKSSLKFGVSEARSGSQKALQRQALKQKI